MEQWEAQNWKSIYDLVEQQSCLLPVSMEIRQWSGAGKYDAAFIAQELKVPPESTAICENGDFAFAVTAGSEYAEPHTFWYRLSSTASGLAVLWVEADSKKAAEWLAANPPIIGAMPNSLSI